MTACFILSLYLNNVTEPYEYAFKSKYHLARHVTSRHDTTRSTCRFHAFWLCRACWTARLDTLVSMRSTRRTCHIVSRREVEFGLYAAHGDFEETAEVTDRGLADPTGHFSPKRPPALNSLRELLWA